MTISPRTFFLGLTTAALLTTSCSWGPTYRTTYWGKSDLEGAATEQKPSVVRDDYGNPVLTPNHTPGQTYNVIPEAPKPQAKREVETVYSTAKDFERQTAEKSASWYEFWEWF